MWQQVPNPRRKRGVRHPAALRNTVIGLIRTTGTTQIAATIRRLVARPREALALLGILHF